MVTGSDHRFRRNYVLALTAALALAFVAMIAGFLEPLALAAVFGAVIHPLYRWFETKLGGRRRVASLLTVSISILVVLVPLLLVLGVVADQAADVAAGATPWFEEQWQRTSSEGFRLPDWLPFAAELEPYTDTIAGKLTEIARSLGQFLAERLARLSQGTVSFFFDFFLMLYALYVFLIHGPTMIERAVAYIPLTRDEQREIINVGASVSRATIKGGLIIGLVQGTLGGIGFAIVGIDAAVFWGAVMVILSVLPLVGAPLVWIPAAIYLIADGQTVAGIGLAAWGGVVVGSVDNVLRAVLVGRDLKMPDLLVLLSTIGGLALFGPSGLVLGPMVAALLFTVLAIYRRVFAESLPGVDDTELSERN